MEIRYLEIEGKQVLKMAGRFTTDIGSRSIHE